MSVYLLIIETERFTSASTHPYFLVSVVWFLSFFLNLPGIDRCTLNIEKVNSKSLLIVKYTKIKENKKRFGSIGNQ